MSGVPYTFAAATTSIPLTQLDVNFATTATLGNASVGLGNTTTVVGNLTLQNPTISGGTAFTLGNTAVTYGGTTTSVGNLTVSNVSINGLSGGGANGVVYINSSNVAVANATVHSIDSNGNMGLGVTPSAWNSSVKGLDISSGGAIYAGSINIGLASNYYLNNSGNYIYKSSTYANGYIPNYANTGVHAWLNAPTGTAGNAISFTQAMTLDNSGRLIIGNTTMPVGYGSALNLYTTGIGARVYGTTETSGPFWVDKQTNTSSTSQVFVQFTINTQATGNGQINGNGASQVAFGSFSDARLKENIVDLQPQLANILALRPVEFDYIESEGGGHQISFIAQEFEKIYSDAVGERPDGMKTLTGWGKTEARMVKAIQELSAQVTTLQSQVAALQAKVGA